MKKTILFLLALLCCTLGAGAAPDPAAASATDPAALWDRANTAYVNGDYEGAALRYDSIRNAGYASHKLFYNLGNAHFKLGEIGPAILNYHKALRLKPSDADTHHNLQVAGTQVKDRIDIVPEFFLRRWIRGIQHLLSGDSWAVTALVLLTVSLGLALVWLLPGPGLRLRKGCFFAGTAAFLLCIAATAFAAADRHETLSPTQAIVMSGAVPVKSAPDDSGTDLFILHEGTAVQILRSVGQWREIAIADGNKGWIENRAIAPID